MKSRFALQLLFWEGAFAMAYETWVGPTYLSGLAGETGVNIRWVSFLVAVPAIGAVGQLLSLGWFQRVESVKKYVVRLALIARAGWIVPIALGWYWGLRSYFSHTAFPASRWFVLTALFTCLSSVLATSSGVGWMAWVRDLVPGGFRGRFFGVRQRYVMAAVLLANAVAWGCVGWNPAGYHLGFGLLLVGALFCAGVSTLFLSWVKDVRLSANERPEFSPGHLLEPLRNPRFRSLIVFGAAFNFSIQLAGPYFPYYFTRELHLPMSTISFWTLLTNLGWFAASAAWGKSADGKRRLGVPFWIALHMIALSPCFYIPGSTSWALRIGPVDYLTNGAFWAGYSLVFTTLLLDACPAGQCALFYSVYSACFGLAGSLGTLAGGELVPLLHSIGGFRSLWGLAALMRLGVIWSLYPLLLRGATEDVGVPIDATCRSVETQLA